MSSLAAVCFTDFIQPLYLIKYKHELDEKKAAYITKGIGNQFKKKLNYFQNFFSIIDWNWINWYGLSMSILWKYIIAISPEYFWSPWWSTPWSDNTRDVFQKSKLGGQLNN